MIGSEVNHGRCFLFLINGIDVDNDIEHYFTARRVKLQLSLYFICYFNLKDFFIIIEG